MPRDGNGVYSLPQPPFIPSTVITSSAVNSDFSDLGSAMTGSLARDGQGGMTGQLPAIDGTVGAPGISFVSDTNTGIRRVTADQLAIVAGGVDALSAGPTGVNLPLGASVTGALSAGSSSVTGALSAGSAVIGAPTGGDQGAGTVNATGLFINAAPVVITSGVRERLTANRTYFVRTDGNDANSGLVNDAGGAWATLQRAESVIQQTLDLNGFGVTVQVADGTYTAGVAAVGDVVGQDSTIDVTYQGNPASPGNVIISVTSNTCFIVNSQARRTIRDMELRTTTSGDCISSSFHGLCQVNNVRFGACAGIHVNVFRQGAFSPVANYSIVGGAQRHINATILGLAMIDGITITLTGTPAFSGQFVRASDNGMAYVNSGNVTFSGAATGQRYNALQGGGIDTEGGGANFFPGSVAGAATAPGFYA